LTKVRVRGIYATALTKLLLDKGFTIVQPSLVIAERFKMAPIEEEPDVVISDREDKHGVLAVGLEEHLSAVLKALREEAPDTIIRKAPFELWAIYKGVVLNGTKRLVGIGSATGVLTGQGSAEELPRPGEEVLVQVVRAERGKPVLSLLPTLRGKFATLRPFQPGVEVSDKIRDVEKAAKLAELARSLLPEGLGLRWRSKAAQAGEEELKADVKALLAAWEEVLNAFNAAEGPCKLAPGKAVADVEFPLEAKRTLDALRASVCPTLADHHALKACGGELANLVEMAEKLLFQGMQREQVERLFREVLAREMPAEGSRLIITHVKLDGSAFRLGEGEILKASPDLSQVLLARKIMGRGLYDGLGARREPGDIALTRTGLGSMRFITSYLAPDGSYKGTYINLNTPVEICPKQLRYVDLEVDICLWPDGQVRVLDEDLLQKAVEEGIISAELAEAVRAEVERTLREIEEGLIGPPGPEELRPLGLEGT